MRHCALLLVAVFGCSSSTTTHPKTHDMAVPDLSVDDLGSGGDLAVADMNVAPPLLAVDHQPKFDFGNVIVGQASASLTLTLTNQGGGQTGALGAATFGSNSPFSVTDDGCVGQTLSGAQSCMVTIVVTPTQNGSLMGTFSVTAAPGGTATLEIDAEGITQGSGPAALLLDKTNYTPSPNPVPVGSPAPATLTLRNVGGAASGNLPTLALTGDSQFSITGGTCAAGASLAAGDSCTIIVTFTPTHFGDANGAISITASPGGTTNATLSATGQQTFTLTMTDAGNGLGSVMVDSTHCTVFPCVVPYIVTHSAPVATVTETFDPTTSVFGGWAIDCTGTGTCAPTMSQDRTVQVNFNLKMFTVTVNIQSIRGATGTVSSNRSPALTCSNGVCTGQYFYDSNVTLTAATSGGSLFQSWDATCANRFSTSCSTGVLTGNFTVNVTFRPPINYMFLTSDDISPVSIGADLLVADQHCDLLARNAGLVNTPSAGPTTFKALLSTSKIDAKDRLKGAEGWIRPDGREFASSPIDLFNDTGATVPYQMFYPPDITEKGVQVQSDLASTGSDANGKFNSNTCNDWGGTGTEITVSLGAPGGGTYTWLRRQLNDGCTNDFRLYCFELDQPATVISPAPVAGARIAFVSNGTINGAAGRGAADALCASEKGSLPGTFLSLLPDTMADGGNGSAASRFNLSGGNWSRPDGVVIASTTSNLMSWTVGAPIEQQANGSYGAAAFVPVWVGATTPSATTIPTNDCIDWSMTSGFALYMTSANSLYDGFNWSSPSQCSNSYHVYCLQQ